MSLIWLDVTTLLGWNRAAVGVVRVESECAYFLLDCGRDDVRFCSFERTSGYHEVPPGEVRAKLDALQPRHPETEVPAQRPDAMDQADRATGAVPTLPKLTRYKRRALALLSRLPPSIAQRLLRFASVRKEAVRNFITSAGYLRLGLRQLAAVGFRSAVSIPSSVTAPPSGFSSKRSTPFGGGDTYLSMGLDWDQKDLAYLHELKKRLDLRIVLFCYDVIPVKFPQLCVGDVASLFGRYFADVAWCADKVLCISECSKRDLAAVLDEIGTPVPELNVVHLGCSVEGGGTLDTKLAERVGDDFILFVSTIERRKNHITLYHAYTRLIDEGVENLPKLVFVGMRGWGVDDLFADLAYDPRVRNRVICLHDVDDRQLNALYDRALFTVFPSLYEGWGLAVGESLARGKFCLASNAASIPEVGEGFAEYLDPLDVPAWAARIRFYVENRNEVEGHQRRIAEDYVPFAWPEAARGIIKAALRPTKPVSAETEPA